MGGAIGEGGLTSQATRMSALTRAFWLVTIGPLILVIPPLRRRFFTLGPAAGEAR